MDIKFLKGKQVRFLSDVTANDQSARQVTFLKGALFTYVSEYNTPPNWWHLVRFGDEQFLVPRANMIDLDHVFRQMSKAEHAEYLKVLRSTEAQNEEDRKRLAKEEADFLEALKRAKEKAEKEGLLDKLGLGDIKKGLYLFGAAICGYQASKAENTTGQILFGSLAAYAAYEGLKTDDK